MEKLDSVIVTLVLKMKEIVIIIIIAKMIYFVDQTIVQLLLVLTLKLTAVINHLSEMNIFVQIQILVEKMKGTVILMMNVMMDLYVDQTTVHLVLGSVMKLTVVQ